jgi:hypothetical protein
MPKQNDIRECDIFDFMATHVGLTVIHPGGLKATSTLAEACGIDKITRVVDIACGKGFMNTGKVMFRYLTNNRIRRRMNTIKKFFKDNADYFGYGIYAGKKPYA